VLLQGRRRRRRERKKKKKGRLGQGVGPCEINGLSEREEKDQRP
jgi:hypothetical protein